MWKKIYLQTNPSEYSDQPVHLRILNISQSSEKVLDFGYTVNLCKNATFEIDLVVDDEKWLCYKGTCHVILLAL